MALSPSGVRFDPVLAYNFLVTFVDSGSELAGAPGILGNPLKDLVTRTPAALEKPAVGGFSEASGLEMSLEVEELKEGGRNDTVRKFPTRVTWTNLRLKRGVAVSDDLWEWHYGFVEGRGKRRDGIVTLQNDLHEAVRSWRFFRGLPVKWTGPSMNAGQSEVAVEELEIAHEGLKLVSSRSLLSIGEAVDLGRDLLGL